MKILLTVDPEIPVPPIGYGGIERIVSSLCRAYTSTGHDVYLAANAKSQEKNVIELFGWQGQFSQKKRDIWLNAKQLGQIVKQISPDIIHSFSRLLYLYPVFMKSKTPVVQSYQREISKKSTAIAAKFAGKRLQFTACGEHMFKDFENKTKWTAIHNFTDVNYFNRDKNAKREFLFFLGRIEDIKGTREAIAAAKQANERLIIAGNVPLEHQGYFDKFVSPYIDNEQINYVGTVNDEQKKHYFQRAKAMLFPIKWEEPFGIVMAEAMACGCPVVGFRRGSVPEVVENGRTGYIVNNVDGMAQAIENLHYINPKDVREEAKKRFSIEVISKKYLSLFEQMV